MAPENSIINFGDLTKPACILIEKISNAAGVLYEPKKIVKKAEAEAKAEAIKALTHLKLSEIEQRAAYRLIHQEARKQKNIDNIITQTTMELPIDANPKLIDDDWLTNFFDKCSNISNEKMQSLWSRLLTEEATNAGKYSKRTVNIVASMSKRDADFFTALGQFVWMVNEEPIPLIYMYSSGNEIYKRSGIDFSRIKHLEYMGLISSSNGDYTLMPTMTDFKMSYFGQSILCRYPENKEEGFNIGCVILTQAGRELLNICGAEKSDEFFKYALDKITGQCIAS